ncbi:hypothetical protein FK85_27105 [Halorubrum saccharovorum]|uniref:Uncharacterized protein n=1 Tax=Halorubrum saccharovorum TaxID=2248 RepID=A0A0F8CL31_9EURY|nr:hypothetical protein FK85_27105 [Halorubrum saccharovorum]
MADWTEKYRPSTLSEVRGNDKARDAFAEWARSWDDHHEAVVLHGSPGVGKTSAVSSSEIAMFSLAQHRIDSRRRGR